MTKRKTKEPAAHKGKWLEIVNWRKAQPKMRGRGNTWMKLYTSLLDHEGFWGLDEASQILIVALWLYAARSGRHVFPADPRWIHKRIPHLKQRPNFKPLLSARDELGNPEPFVRYCEAPSVEEAEPEAAAKPKSQRGTKRAPSTKKEKREERREEKRVEKTRAEQKRPPNPNGFGKRERERKERVSPGPRTQKATAQQSRAEETQKPANPKESEVEGAARSLPRSTPPPSAQRIPGVHRIGEIIRPHWVDRDAEAFGWEIVEGLGLGTDRADRELRSQWGSFAAWWVKAKTTVPELQLGELRTTAVAKAVYIRTKGRSAQRPGAVWQAIMRAELARFSTRGPPAAAM